jgi:glycosyltransferase involved in cell wall biosynthesis
MGRSSREKDWHTVLRIGFVSTVQNYKWAGSEELWWRAASMAIAEGHEVGCLLHSPLDQSDQIRELEQSGATVFVRRSDRHPRVTKALERFSSALHRLKKWTPDVIVVSLGSPLDLTYWNQLYRTLLNEAVPFYLVLQFNADSLGFTAAQRESVKNLFSRCRHSVFVSQHNRDLTERQLAIDLPNSSVIFNPFRLQVSAALSWPVEEPLTMGCVARFETRWKGHDVLLNCLAQPQWQSRDWKLNLYGSGPDEQYIQDLIKHYGLEHRVHMCGYVRDMQRVWSECHIKVLASHGEGTPLAVLEAMMCGRPVITTDVGGNREVLTDGETGFIADAATPRSFGIALEAAWQRRDDWMELGEKAHLRAVQLHGLEPAQALLTVVTREVRRGDSK